MSDKNFKVKNGADIGGTVTATAFVGDGSGITGISSYSAPTLGSTSIGSGATVTNVNGLTINSTTIPTSATLTKTADKLSVFAATTSAELAGVISDETGTGALVFANTPTLVTPSLGVATATSINGLVVRRGGGDVSSNVAVGPFALASNTTGAFNVAVGDNALAFNTTGGGNAAVGTQALGFNTTGGNNAAVGNMALISNTAGTRNSAVGNNASRRNTTGTDNVAMGDNAASFNTTGNYNTALGATALYFNKTGGYNTAIGAEALFGDFDISASFNTAVGYGAGSTTSYGTNNAMLGYNARASSSVASNTVTLGNESITTLRCQVTSITALSDARDKTDVESIPVGLDFVNKLNPVTFTWNMRDGGKVGVKDTGFIAQELMATEDEAELAEYLQLTYRDNPEKLEATQGRLIPILVKAVQELSAKVAELEAKGK